MLKATINNRFQPWRDFLLSIPQRMDAEGTWIYGGRRNLIKSFPAPDGTVLVVKRYQRPQYVNKIVYSFGLRKPKGERAYKYAFILKDHGIDTPEPIAYIEHRSCHLLLDSYLVTLECPYPHRLYEMGNATADVYEPMAKALAAFTAHMHDEGILHCDFSPGNILWDKKDGNYSFSLVDINRMKFGHVGMRAGCESFARLWGPKAFIVLLTKEYAAKRGFDERQAVETTLRARRKFWLHYQKKRKMEFKLEL